MMTKEELSKAEPLNEKKTIEMLVAMGYELSTFKKFEQDSNSRDFVEMCQTAACEHNLTVYLPSVLPTCYIRKFYVLHMSNGIHIRAWALRV